MEKTPSSDVAIIGAGPAGLFAAFYAGLRSLQTRVFEALPFVGGQVAALYPEKTILDVGGFPAIRGAELVAALERQSQLGGPAIHLDEAVTGLRRTDTGFVLSTAKGEYTARAVIVAVGVGRFSPRPAGVQDVDRWEGRGLLRTVHDLGSYRGARVLVVGGGDSALDWAAELADVGAEVTLVHRREEFRGLESSLTRAEQAGVRIRRSTVVDALVGDRRPERALLRHISSGWSEEVHCDAVVLALGFVADLSLVRTWGLPLDGRGIVVAPDTMATAPGVFAIGDAVTYPGKLKLIATAFAEAALAVSAAATSLDPRARLQVGHSTAISADPDRSSPGREVAHLSGPEVAAGTEPPR